MEGEGNEWRQWIWEGMEIEEVRRRRPGSNAWMGTKKGGRYRESGGDNEMEGKGDGFEEIAEGKKKNMN